jgi:hypothetical protein
METRGPAETGSSTAPVSSRICVHCGKLVAPDRKQLCDHCAEVFYAPGDRPAIDAARPTGVGAPPASRRGVVLGLILAFAIPASYWVLAILVQHGIAPYDQVHALLGALGTIALLEVLVGPLGIGIVAWSARIREAAVWAALFILGIPGLAIVWFFAVANLSGTLGNPF